jgi:CRP/FNR family transcriptional regulator, cyclic AMP receptor protein
MAPRILNYAEGEKIISAGKVEKRMFIILEGMVEIFLSDGQHRVTVANMQKGDFFGEISLFTNTPRSANAVAVGDVRLAYIDNDTELKAFLVKNPAFAAKMVNILSRRLAKTDEILIGKVTELSRLKITI